MVDESGQVSEIDDARVPESMEPIWEYLEVGFDNRSAGDESLRLIEPSEAGVPGSADLEEQEEEKEEWGDDIHAEIERRVREAACDLGIHRILSLGASLTKPCSASD
jgi:hypothetical protein